MDQLNVLVIESRPGAGDGSVEELRRGGHHVERCHEPGQPAFPCRGLVDRAACPLDGVDVALSVRHGVTPRPTRLEGGLICALRAGIPVVEDGPEVLDPFQAWLSGRVERSEGELVASCTGAVERTRLPLKDELRAATALILADAGMESDVVTWTIECLPERTVVRASGPPLDGHTRSRLAIRALDVLRGIASRRDRIDVSYESIP